MSHRCVLVHQVRAIWEGCRSKRPMIKDTFSRGVPSPTPWLFSPHTPRQSNTTLAKMCGHFAFYADFLRIRSLPPMQCWKTVQQDLSLQPTLHEGMGKVNSAKRAVFCSCEKRSMVGHGILQESFPHSFGHDCSSEEDNSAGKCQGFVG